MADILTHEQVPDEVRQELHRYPYLIQHLLHHRGITDAYAAEVFLRPDYDRDIHSPFLLDGMQIAVDRIESAMKKNEIIAVYHDYDMDGIPGGIILHDCFKGLQYDNVIFYTPHRNRDGFGLHRHAIDQLKDRGVTLIITVDCGITGVDQVTHASNQEIDVIITDHHLPGTELPSAFAIVNPNKGTCDYPNKNLCGAGVAWQLARALGVTNEKWMLDMVGAATLSDMVALTGENRALVYFGMKVLRKSRRPGLVALFKKTKITQSYLSEEDLTFMIAPRINAASRMDNPELAFTTLATDSAEEAHEQASELEELNNKRKGTVAAMVKDARKRLAERDVQSVIVIGDPDWLPGLAGLVANTLAEEFDRPTFVYGGSSESPDILKGSCRGNGRCDVVALMKGAQETLLEFGGHANSGGFGVTKEHIHLLEKELVDSLKSLTTKDIDDSRVVDMKLQLSDVTWDTFRQIEQLGPFGIGNPKPIFALEEVVPTSISNFGKEDNHLKLVFEGCEAIGFFMTREQFNLIDGEPITVIVHMEQSFFRGRPELRLRIVDIVS